MQLQQFYFGNLGTDARNEHQPIAASADWNAIVSRLQLDIRQYELVIRSGYQENSRWGDAWIRIVKKQSPYIATGVFDLGQSGTLVVRLMRHYMHRRFPYLYHYLYLSPEHRTQIAGNWTSLFIELNKYDYFYAHNEDHLKAVRQLYDSMMDEYPSIPFIDPFIFDLTSHQNDDPLDKSFDLYGSSPKILERLAHILMRGGTIAFEDEPLNERLSLVLAITGLLPPAMRGMVSFADDAPVYNNGKLQIIFPGSDQSVVDSMFRSVWRVNRQKNTIIPPRFPEPVPLVDTMMAEFRKGKSHLAEFQARWDSRTKALTQKFGLIDTCAKLETWIDITRDYHDEDITHVSRDKRIALLKQLEQDSSLTKYEIIDWLLIYLDKLIPHLQKDASLNIRDEFYLWFSLVLPETYLDIEDRLRERLNDNVDGICLWLLTLYGHVSNSPDSRWDSNWTEFTEQALSRLEQANLSYDQRKRYYQLFDRESVPSIDQEIWHNIIRTFIKKAAEERHNDELEILLKLVLDRWRLDVIEYAELSDLLFSNSGALPVPLRDFVSTASRKSYSNIIAKLDLNDVDAIKIAYLIHLSGSTGSLADEQTVEMLVGAYGNTQFPTIIREMAGGILKEISDLPSQLQTNVKAQLIDWHLETRQNEQGVSHLISTVLIARQIQDFIQYYRRYFAIENMDHLFAIVHENFPEFAWRFAFELMRSYSHPQRIELRSAWQYTISRLCNVETEPQEYDRAFFKESRLYFEMLNEAQNDEANFAHLIEYYIRFVTISYRPSEISDYLLKLNQVIPAERRHIYRHYLAAVALRMEKNTVQELLNTVHSIRQLRSTAQVLEAVTVLQDVFPKGIDVFRQQIIRLFPVIYVIYHLEDQLDSSQIVKKKTDRYGKQRLRKKQQPAAKLAPDATKALSKIKRTNADFVRYEKALSERLIPGVVLNAVRGTPDRFTVHMRKNNPAKTVIGLWLRVAAFTLKQSYPDETNSDQFWDHLHSVRSNLHIDLIPSAWEKLLSLLSEFENIFSTINQLFVSPIEIKHSILGVVHDVMLPLLYSPQNGEKDDLEFVAILLELLTMIQRLIEEFGDGMGELSEEELKSIRQTKKQNRAIDQYLNQICNGKRPPKTRIGKWLMLTTCCSLLTK